MDLDNLQRQDGHVGNTGTAPPTGSWHDLGKLGEAMLGPVGLWAGLGTSLVTVKAEGSAVHNLHQFSRM